MEWIAIKDKKPDHDIVALVNHDSGYMREVKATYDAREDIWRHYEPKNYDTLLLDVTHYLPIPPFKDFK